MMRSIFLILALSSSVHAEAPAARPTMQKYAENVSILLQNLKPFDNGPDKEQRKSVLQALSTLKGLSHDVRPTLDLYAVDPVMKYLSIDLSSQFTKIEDAYSASSYSLARSLLRQTTQYCVGCHAASSIKHSAVALFKEPSGTMSDLERAEYFSATRRHEEAMVAYEKFLSNKKMKIAQPDLWEKALENLLAITIRLRGDASITLEMISAILDEGGYTPQQKEQLQTWRASAKAWQLETGTIKGKDALEKARQRLAKGHKLSELGKNFGFVEYMRAAAVLNEIAASDISDEHKAQGYLLAGEMSENLRDVFIWMRPEAYYEACIRMRPHSIEAKACVKRWEIWQNQIPPSAAEKDKFRQLVELSQ